MKKLLKYLLIIFVSLIVIVDVLVTIYLINFNEYNVSQFGKYSILLIDKEVGSFNKHDLLIIKKNDNEDIKTNDYIFYYDTTNKKSIINYGKVYSVYKVNEEESTFTVEDNLPLSSEYVIGKGDTSTVISDLGLPLSVVSSRWGYLFLIIFPVAMLLVVQAYLLFEEIRNEKRG